MAEGTVSISDVAERAGVSVGTVSNTINRPESVRKLTREAVLNAIEELNYVPNQHARALTGIQSQMVGLIVLDINSPFFMELAESIEETTNSSGNVVVLCNSHNSRTKEDRILSMLSAQRVRGALITPASALRGNERSRDHAVPLVYLDYHMPEGFCSVSVDNVAGAKLAIDYLLDLGHTQLAFVGDPDALHQFRDRFQGAESAIHARGLDSQAHLRVVKVPGLSLRDGVEAGKALLAEDTMPTGIFCGNDMMAFGVYRELSAAGIHIPEDVSLVGYDDNEFSPDWIVPLTTIHQPIRELGKIAAELLLEHTRSDGHHQHQQIVLQPELVVRSSSGFSNIHK